jgi:hypothetical protein
MPDIPEDAKKQAAKAAEGMWEKFTSAAAGESVVDGFAKVEAASSRTSLVVESPAAALPSAMDPKALEAAKSEAKKSIYDELASTIPTKDTKEPEPDLDR